jgi:hypothetical protein
MMIRELQIKTIMKYHYSSIRITNVKKLGIPIAGEDMEQPELLFITVGKRKS